MKPFLKTKDHSVSQEEFTLLYDESSDMLITDPQPNELEKYYESEDYISHTDASESFVDKIYQAVKKYSLNKKVRLINGLTSDKKSLLDIGAGTGDFLLTAKNKGWKIDGVEPNKSARNKALEKGLKLEEDLSALSKEKYNVISLWHVLEHLPNLEEQIKTIKSKLEKDGVLIVAVPNYKSYDAKHYKNFWAAYDVPRHLWHFSKSAIENIFGEHQMKVVKTKPMLFDAFYVSLLSEKYKSGKQNLFKAFYRGLRSNIYAMRTKEHSSVIYIIKNA